MVVLVAAKAVITDEVSAVGTPDTPRGGSPGVEGQVSASQDCRRGMSAPAHRPEDAESGNYYWDGVHESKAADGVS